MSNTTIQASQKLIYALMQMYPAESAGLMNSLSVHEIIQYLQKMPVQDAAEIFSRINPEISEEIISEMKDNFFKELFEAIDPAISARLLSRLADKKIKKLLGLLSPPISKEIRELLIYPAETAGFIMDPSISMFQVDSTVENVLQKIRMVKNRRIINIHVVNEEGKLIGIVPLQEVAVSLPEKKLEDMINKEPFAIQAMAPREDVVTLMEEQKLLSIPVVDAENNLLGVIRYDALVNAAKQDVSEDLQAMFGAGRDEQALSKASFAIRKRLPWLEINLATAFLAAAVVGFFEETIAKITVLAVFLPVVAGQSGNTGSQALSVTMRGLALREIRTRHWFQVARKEILVGFVNGCAIALTTSIIVYFWAASFGLALVIAVAMVVSMVIAGFSGAVIPILLKAFGQDPAQSSSIVLTTVTDIVGFLSFLGLATALVSILNLA